MINGFKLNAISDFKEEAELKTQELLSKLESPDSGPYHRNRTFTVNQNGVFLRKGEELGMFEMGSTIVLLFESPKDRHFINKEGDKVVLG